MAQDFPRLFVVDDDDSVRRALRRLFQCVGIPAETYDSAEAFLDRSGATAAGCLILDAHLPGMSGLELQMRLKVDNPRMNILFISGDMDEGLREKAVSQGAIAFLNKPFQDRTILDVVTRALRLDIPN
jgi:FixJ family two-component response regulator